MRLRHIPGSEQQIAESPYVIGNPEEKKAHWADVFGNENPVHIEVGMGKGKFLMELAGMHPDINYVGIERYSTVLLKAIRKQEALKLPNLFFLREDAGTLADIFGPGEVAKIYLNFSDPWPKDRHAKRRLTSPRFMAVYDRILKPEGIVEFKTDNQELFAYSLQSVPEAGWNVDWHTFDLHHSEYGEGNVMTEYEAKFSAQGKPICKLTASRKAPVSKI
ncbi:MAG: tRNA (guanosine(46)-N7)-methyltransferase TrmB [Hungatella sp.]|jgi:tRNA (guanine-N7-)-methyltransferase|nr:tRNA (guanosine(46)-N7)-methyltransferase TrmB [Hungatella sp.]